MVPAPNSPDAKTGAQERIDDYAVLNTPREPAFDRLVFTAAQLFRVPFVTIGLLDGERHWFKAQVGLELTEMSRHITFCEHVLRSDGVVVVEDAEQDERFAANLPENGPPVAGPLAAGPLVAGPPHIRFYAGVALITPDRIRVGSMCLGDRYPKTLSSRQAWQLEQFAGQAVALLESRRSRI